MATNDDGPSFRETVIEDKTYLSRSGNRLQLLEVLGTAGYTSRELAETTEIPRSTLRRILTELEQRGWIERTIDGEYTITPTGAHVATETARYVGALTAINALGDAVYWLPEDELTASLYRF